MGEPVAHLRDLDDGNGLHLCGSHDPGAFPVYGEPMTISGRQTCLGEVDQAAARLMPETLADEEAGRLFTVATARCIARAADALERLADLMAFQER